MCVGFRIAKKIILIEDELLWRRIFWHRRRESKEGGTGI